MESHKIIVLVLAADIFGYDKLIQSGKDTWAKFQPPGYKILYYYGYRENHPRPTPNTVLRDGDDLICGLDENMPNINAKNYLAFSYLYNNFEFDYVFRCCAGSYVNLHNIDKYLAAINPAKTGFYCGVIGYVGSAAFASGSGFFASRDVVKLMIDSPAGCFLCHPHDDVAMGVYLASKGVKIRSGERQDLFDISQINRDHYHFHFRHNTDMMQKVHKALGR